MRYQLNKLFKFAQEMTEKYDLGKEFSYEVADNLYGETMSVLNSARKDSAPLAMRSICNLLQRFIEKSDLVEPNDAAAVKDSLDEILSFLTSEGDVEGVDFIGKFFGPRNKTLLFNKVRVFSHFFDRNFDPMDAKFLSAKKDLKLLLGTFLNAEELPGSKGWQSGNTPFNQRKQEAIRSGSYDSQDLYEE